MGRRATPGSSGRTLGRMRPPGGGIIVGQVLCLRRWYGVGALVVNGHRPASAGWARVISRRRLLVLLLAVSVVIAVVVATAWRLSRSWAPSRIRVSSRRRTSWRRGSALARSGSTIISVGSLALQARSAWLRPTIQVHRGHSIGNVAFVATRILAIALVVYGRSASGCRKAKTWLAKCS